MPFLQNEDDAFGVINPFKRKSPQGYTGTPPFVGNGIPQGGAMEESFPTPQFQPVSQPRIQPDYNSAGQQSVGQLPAGADMPAGGAPMRQSMDVNTSDPGSFQSVSGLDPYSPIKRIQQHQRDLEGAAAEAEAARQIPISGKRKIFGALAGAATGAFLGPQAGASIGSSIVNAPRNEALGLAERRAQRATDAIGQAKDEAGMIDNARQGYQREQDETGRNVRAGQESADRGAAREMQGREIYAPTEAGGRMVQTSKYAPAPGQQGQTPIDVGAAPVDAQSRNVKYQADQGGNLFMISVGPDGRPVTEPVIGPDGNQLRAGDMTPNDLDKYLAADQATRRTIREYRQSGVSQVPIQLDNTRNQRETTQNTAVTDAVSRIQAMPEVSGAYSSGNQNAYRQAVEQYLSRIAAEAPSYAPFIPAIRQELLRNLPRPNTGGGGTNLRDLLTPPAAPPK
jgi:hypothetical protein